jgi:predicted nucleic acid-binding Zn ribbon protein
MDDSRIKTAAELVSALISPEAAAAAGNWAKVVGVWPALVGVRAAAHSRIVDLSNHFLLIEADHPGWIQTLQFRQVAILEGIQNRFPALEVRGLQFRLTQEGGGRHPAAEKPPEPCGATEPSKETNDAPLPHLDTETIQDETLKKALQGLRDALEGK